MIIDNNGRTMVVITGGAYKGHVGLAWPKRERDNTVRVDLSENSPSSEIQKDPNHIRPATLQELRVA